MGEANTDALADLPLPVLFGWQDYMRIQASGQHQGLSPESALEMFRKKYGQR